MVRRIPPELIRQVTQSSEGASFTEVAQTEVLLRALGRERPAVNALVFVEDDLASRLVQTLLRRYAPEIVERFDIIASGGKDQALRGADILRRSQRLKAIVVLDADQRDEIRAEGVLFLPGEGVPEFALLETLRTRESDAAKKLRVSVSDLRISLQAARLASHQRVFATMGDLLLGHSANELRDVAIDFWVEADGIAASARLLVEAMIKMAFSER